ncbi:HPP family protein [Paraglaciecola sp. L3A3]|uniref:CBS domain-containing protein n=1 Tax=Paraglaciecola sp. L3A3 TaxID=2686358 RepID=UPI00131CA207|nr:CBS domain-containing protein [Paraglaciecola sp. L3A3]
MIIDKCINQDIKQALNQVNISKIMSNGVLTVYEGWSIRRLSKFFIKHNISGAPVIAADDELVGVVTQSDIIRFESHEPSEQEIQKLVTQFCGPFAGNMDESEIRRIQDKANDYCTVNSIMTTKVFSINGNANIYDAYELIVKNDIHRLFITEKGILKGVVTTMDILKYLLEDKSTKQV